MPLEAATSNEDGRNDVIVGVAVLDGANKRPIWNTGPTLTAVELDAVDHLELVA